MNNMYCVVNLVMEKHNAKLLLVPYVGISMFTSEPLFPTRCRSYVVFSTRPKLDNDGPITLPTSGRVEGQRMKPILDILGIPPLIGQSDPTTDTSWNPFEASFETIGSVRSHPDGQTCSNSCPFLSIIWSSAGSQPCLFAP